MPACGKMIIFNLKETSEVMSEWIWLYDEIIYEDRHGRRWKLEPLDNENISFPFRITPLAKES